MEDKMKYKLALYVCIGVLFFGVVQRGRAIAQTTEDNKAKTMQAYNAFNTDDWDKLATLMAPDFIDHNPDPGQKPGFEGVKEDFAGLRKAFPDFKFIINHMVAEGDWVCVHYTMTATNKGAFMGMPATGKSMTVDGFDLLHIVKGVATERWGVFDNAAMMMQLGMTPPPPPGSEKEEKKN